MFCENFVVKFADTNSKFSWHQDSGYVGHNHPPYINCWTALDDVNVHNGTLYLLPFSRAGMRELAQHRLDPDTDEMVGYTGKDPGIPGECPAGSIAVFSSLTFHRSSTHRPKSSRTMRHWIGWSATVIRRPKIWTNLRLSEGWGARKTGRQLGRNIIIVCHNIPLGVTVCGHRVLHMFGA